MSNDKEFTENMGEIFKLVEELEKDRSRLDWLQANHHKEWAIDWGLTDYSEEQVWSLRMRIDHAMNEIRYDSKGNQI